MRGQAASPRDTPSRNRSLVTAEVLIPDPHLPPPPQSPYSQCYVHSSGALLLDYRDGERYDSRLRYTPAYRPAAGQQQGAAAHPTQQQQLQAPLLLKGSAEDDEDDDDGGGGGGGDDDDEEEGGDAVMKDAAAAAAAAAAVVATGAGIAPVAAAAAGAADGGCKMVPNAAAGVGPPGGVRREDGEEEEEEEDGGEEEFFDPYKPLDAHVPGNLPLKPMQVWGGRVRYVHTSTPCVRRGGRRLCVHTGPPRAPSNLVHVHTSLPSVGMGEEVPVRPHFPRVPL